MFLGLVSLRSAMHLRRSQTYLLVHKVTHCSSQPIFSACFATYLPVGRVWTCAWAPRVSSVSGRSWRRCAAPPGGRSARPGWRWRRGAPPPAPSPSSDAPGAAAAGRTAPDGHPDTVNGRLSIGYSRNRTWDMLAFRGDVSRTAAGDKAIAS